MDSGGRGGGRKAHPGELSEVARPAPVGPAVGAELHTRPRARPARDARAQGAFSNQLAQCRSQLHLQDLRLQTSFLEHYAKQGLPGAPGEFWHVLWLLSGWEEHREPTCASQRPGPRCRCSLLLSLLSGAGLILRQVTEKPTHI